MPSSMDRELAYFLPKHGHQKGLSWMHTHAFLSCYNQENEQGGQVELAEGHSISGGRQNPEGVKGGMGEHFY